MEFVNYAKESDMEKRNIFLTFVLATLKTAKCRDLLLDMKTARLSEDGRILGVIAFDDTTYAGFDSFGRSIEIEMPVGTILLEESLVNDSRHVGRQRFIRQQKGYWS